MKTIVKALLAASMLVPAAVQAQEIGTDAGVNAGQSRRGELREIRDRARAERGDQPDRGDQQSRGDRQPRPEPAPQFRQEARAEPQPQVAPQARFAPQSGGDVRQDRGGDRRQFRADRGDAGQDFARDRRDERQDLRQGSVPPGQFRADRGNDRRDFRNDRPQAAQRGQQWNRNGYEWRDDAAARGRFDDRRAWNRGWRSDNRYNYDRYRSVNRRAFSLPRYYAPSGWGYGYRRFSIGVTLSASLWDENYWIDDPYAYRLPDAYGPYRWVRYYDDALLIDIRTGRVVDMVYDLFY